MPVCTRFGVSCTRFGVEHFDLPRQVPRATPAANHGRSPHEPVDPWMWRPVIQNSEYEIQKSESRFKWTNQLVLRKRQRGHIPCSKCHRTAVRGPRRDMIGRNRALACRAISARLLLYRLIRDVSHPGRPLEKRLAQAPPPMVARRRAGRGRSFGAYRPSCLSSAPERHLTCGYRREMMSETASVTRA